MSSSNDQNEEPLLLSDGSEMEEGATRTHYDCLSVPQRPRQWQYVWTRYALYIGAGLAVLLSIFYIAKVALDAHTPVPDSSKGSRCSKSPADCETTAPFVFDSIYALAKQWPKIYAPNGHSIVPVTFPVGMPLYHANHDEHTVRKPTWFAFDSEMSLGIYGGSGITFLHTSLPTRKLNLLYFDGESATLTACGSLDSQTALLREHIELYPSDDFTYEEYPRGNELCALAQELACDTDASGIREIFVTNVTVPGNFFWEQDSSLPQEPNRQPPFGFGNTFVMEYGRDWARSATWHYGGFGNSGGSRPEDRVELDLCGMITFYDPLLHSLSGNHVGGIRGKDKYENGWGLRRGHRLVDISREDARTVKTWVRQVLNARRPLPFLQKLFRFLQTPLQCSGINWQVVTEIITDSHRSRAIEIADVFRKHGSGEINKTATMNRIHELSHAVLSPFFQYPRGKSLTFPATKVQTISRCSMLYTSYIASGSFNEFESLLKDSISIVLRRLCEWEWDLFEWTENHTTNIFKNPERVPGKPGSTPTATEINRHKDSTSDILNWLGWSTWTDCPSKCGVGEMCYIPMWPVVYSNGTRQGSIYAGSRLTKEEEVYFWSPKCIDREMWFKAGGRGRDPKHLFPDLPENERDEDH